MSWRSAMKSCAGASPAQRCWRLRKAIGSGLDLRREAPETRDERPAYRLYRRRLCGRGGDNRRDDRLCRFGLPPFERAFGRGDAGARGRAARREGRRAPMSAEAETAARPRRWLAFLPLAAFVCLAALLFLR